jgi:hypothetical protein
MKPFNSCGYEKVLHLINQGLQIKEIKNHPDSSEFLSYHKQVKLMLIKKIIMDDPEKESILLMFYKTCGNTSKSDI